MANEENLIPKAHELTVEEQSKGGIASGKSRRRKKQLRDTVKMLLALPLRPGKLDALVSYDTLNGKNRTVEEQLILKQIEKASRGDLQSFNALMKLAGGDDPDANRHPVSDLPPDRTFLDALKNKAAEVWQDAEG